MTTIEQCAKSAALEFVDTYEKMTMKMIADWKRIGLIPTNVNIDLFQLGAEEDTNKIAEKVAKHFAPVAELQALLVELARKMQELSNNRGAINLCKAVGMAVNPEWIEKANAAEKAIVELLAAPLVAAAIKDSAK